MSERLKNIEKQLSKQPWNYFGLKDLLNEQYKVKISKYRLCQQKLSSSEEPSSQAKSLQTTEKKPFFQIILFPSYNSSLQANISSLNLMVNSYHQLYKGLSLQPSLSLILEFLLFYFYNFHCQEELSISWVLKSKRRNI